MRAFRCGPVVLLAVLALPVLAWADGQGWQPGFHAPGVTGNVACVLDFQGQLVIGGTFTAAADVPAVNIARWDGALWHSVGQGLSRPITALAEHEGQVVAAWGKAPPCVVGRCDDDDVWTPLGEANGAVTALASFNGQIYAAGTFTTIGGVGANRIARWNGTSWEALAGGGTNASVKALAVGDSALYVGGEFTLAGGVPAAHVARWDGSAWSALGAGLNSVVNGLVMYQGQPVATGAFSSPLVGSTKLMAMAWDGTEWRSLGPEGYYTNGLKLTADEGALYLLYEDTYIEHGDYYPEARQHVGVLRGTTWTWFFYSPDYNRIEDIAAWDGAVAIGGSVQIGGAGRGLVIWRSGQWTVLGPLGQGVANHVNALAADPLGVLAAGSFQAAGTVACGGVARWSGQGWTAIRPFVQGDYNSALAVGATESGNVYYGGSRLVAWSTYAVCPFLAWCSVCLAKEAVYSVNTMFPYQGNMLFGLTNCTVTPLVTRNNQVCGLGTWGPGSVLAFTLHDGLLYAGGGFSEVDGQEVHSVAVLRDGVWSPVGDGPGITVNALASWNGLLIAGGAVFVDYAERGVVKAWDGATWRHLTLLPMDPVTSYTGVRALAAHDGDLIAGGAFTAIDGVAARGLARWDGDAWHEVGGGVAGSVSALLSTGDRLYVGGDFTLAGGLPALNFACWQGGLVAVRLTGFSCARAAGGAAVTWTVEAAGGAGFHVWREEPDRDRVRLTAAPLSGATSFVFTDPSPPVTAAEYWLEELAADGGTSSWHGPARLAAAQIPAALRLAQNRPNPFNPRTTFTLALPQPGRVRLTIHDARGREVARLVDAELPAGERDVVWDGRDAAGRALASGVYFARLVCDGRLSMTKVTLAR